MATAAASSAAILSTMKHVTANKWAKANSRLEEIKGILRDTEAELAYVPSSSSATQGELEGDIIKLLAAVRQVYAGSPDRMVQSHAGLRAKRGELPLNTGAFDVYIRMRRRLDAIERLLSNTKYSSGLSTSAPLSWRAELLGYLRQSQRRMEYTILFGKLTNEWANSRFGELSKIESDKKSTTADGSMSDDGSVTVGRKEMHEQRQIWEDLIMKERTSDKEKITGFLDDLFQTGPEQKEDVLSEILTDRRTMLIRNLRESVKDSFKQPMDVSTDTVKSAIKAILSADQLTSEKRRAMIDLKGRNNVLQEIADILNIDLKLSALDRWSWGDTPIKAQMRKAINGKYRVYMDIELLDSILIQCVGQFISVRISDALERVWNSDVADVWLAKKDEKHVAAIEAQLPNFRYVSETSSVTSLRNNIYKKRFFSTRLPKTMCEENGSSAGYDDDHSHKKSSSQDLLSGVRNPYTLKDDILRVCVAEMGMQKIVHGQFCILQSDFEWFGPSLPHSTLVAILEYFKFPKEIVNFVQSFLHMKMHFEEDGENGAVMERKTGIPVSFQITDGIAELLLFLLDFAVNQRTGGAHLYRNHDDLWFWGQPSQCIEAWKTIREFTSIMGLQLNKEKTAFAHAVDTSNPRFKPVAEGYLAELPAGDLKWGFLQFDEKQWRWAPNKKSIETHMDELRFQLKSRTSVMDHVQAYNAYMKNFLPNNFGDALVGMGDDHPATVLEALEYAQKHLYRSVDGEASVGSVASHVRKTIEERFGDSVEGGIPDCFLFMEVESGGLGLANPAPAFAKYIPLPEHAFGWESRSKPPLKRAFEELTTEVSKDYHTDSKAFAEKMNNKRQKLRLSSKLSEAEDDYDFSDDASFVEKIDGIPQFMSYSKYMSLTEQRSPAMVSFYETLLSVSDTDNQSVSNEHLAAKMFDGELEDSFGGFIAEEEFLPLGLYRTLAEEKVRWTG